MDDIREYLIGVVAAAVLCGVVTDLVSQKGTLAIAIRFMTGLLMVLAVIRPWVSIRFDGLSDWSELITGDGKNAAASGEWMAQNAYYESIKQRLEAYILDEAKVLGCELKVDVTLSANTPPVPVKAQLEGAVSPYARQKLTRILEEQLGIKQEDQIWI